MAEEKETLIVNSDAWKGLGDNELAKMYRVLEGLGIVKRDFLN